MKGNDMEPYLKGSVLVVEDYAPSVMVAALWLENLGFNVTTASSGEAALDILSRTETPFTAILMDVEMQGMTGYEATQRIREMEVAQGGHNIIIGVTAHALAGDRERCISAGMDDYMSKPIHPDLLAAKLEKLAPRVLSAA